LSSGISGFPDWAVFVRTRKPKLSSIVWDQMSTLEGLLGTAVL